MKYQILFTQQFNGVWALHETFEKAQSHIKTLLEMSPNINNALWSILENGQEIKTNKKR